jgi:tetratricopeptide (TPR) repeat protein
MKRIRTIGVALLVMLLLPSAVSAQKDTKQTREANKYIGLAMTKQTPEERAELYRQAMEHLREGMAEDAENAQVWKLAGTALAALGDAVEADRAFDRAVQLHPAYAEEIEAERETAWVESFNQGIQLMDQQQYPEAIAALEAAQLIYDQRPEALMNLGALYSNAGDQAKAEKALRDAIAATHGPLFEKLNEDQQAEWVRFRMMAAANIAQIQAQQGIESFEAQQFDSAAVRFLRAAETNPQGRDYWFNYGQALWAMSTPLEDALADTTASVTAADSARIRDQLSEIYSKIQTAAQKSREFDPNNEVLYLMEARTHRMAGVFEGGASAGQQAALRLLEAHGALAVTLDQIAVQPNAENGVTIRGMLTNMKATEGSTVTLRFTLLDLEGTVVGEQAITVAAPAAEQSVAFEGAAPTTGEVAGWKYVVVGS